MNDSKYFETLFNHASIGIVVVDKNAVIQSVNPFGLKLFGFTRKALIGQSLDCLIPARFQFKHLAHHASYFKNPKSRPMGRNMELYAAKKDGSEFPVEIGLVNYHHDDKHEIIAFVNDITDRKKDEARIKQLNNELELKVAERTRNLQEALAQLEQSKLDLQKALTLQQAMLMNAGAMIITTDQNGIIQTFNPEAERELGYKAEELIGKCTATRYLDPDFVAAKLNELADSQPMKIATPMDFLQTKLKQQIPLEEEWIYVRKDGSKFPVQLNISPMQDNNNGFIGYVAVSINISRRKQIEQELNIALEKEKELNGLKSRFVSMASHEFRTPLSTVLSSTYLLQKYTLSEEQDKRDKHIKRIVSSVTILTDILNDFLSVGKIEEGKLQVRNSLFNIRDMILGVAREFSNIMKPLQEIRYKHTGEEEVELDITLLKHIIMNLISNAIKFSNEGNIIDIKTHHKKGQLKLSVKDQGIGISKQDQKHLSERFFRGLNAGNIQGTGLGLHLVSKYAEMMNGTVECKSELDKGSEFIITFNMNQS